MRIIYLLLVFVPTLFGCKQKQKNILTQSIFIFKDKDGLYEYDPILKKEKLIFEALKEQFFLDKPCEFCNDTILIPIKGNYKKNDEKDYTKGGSYEVEYYSVDVANLKNWLSKKIVYKQKKMMIHS